MALPELNAPQAEAVLHVNGPLLVFAGAGSGKTRVITYRIANLVARERVLPWRILAVTFTNKAAGEMRARLESPELLGPIARDLWVGTFHSTCVKFLRQHPEAARRTKSFVVYDATDQKAVVTRALRDLDLDDRRYPPKVVLGRIHKEKQEGRGPRDMGRDSYVDDVIQKVYAKYEAALEAANALDFEDLILSVVRMLEAPPDAEPAILQAQDALTRKFDYVLVDEFQDTNQIQYRLIRALAARSRNLCVVGDDDQSIYRWRGADVRNIRGFRRDYPDARVVKLEQNYRSTKRIVASALAIIAPAMAREEKELWTSNDEGAPVRVIQAADERDEAACVVRALSDAREAGMSPKDIAVFYRVHAQSRVLEEALRSVSIPYQIIGGMRFYERAEVKDAIAYLRVLVNPKSDVDLFRIINTPARGIGATTIERVASYASVQGISVFDALERLEEFSADVGAAPRKRLLQFRELLRGLMNEAADAAPADALRAVLARSGYRKALESEDSAEAEGRLENLAELEGSMHDYAVEAEARGEVPSLGGFLERVTLQSDGDAEVGEKVSLMTVHGAKGLEFDLVLLTGMEEDMFPYRNQEPRNAEEMDEERRLAYVAVTRARKHLVITHAHQRQIFGTTRLGVPSRFIGDLPKGAADHLETAAAKSVGSSRWIDRPSAFSGSKPRSFGGPSRTYGGGSPRESAPPPRAPGERFVEYEATDMGGESPGLRRGMAVAHDRFGRGEVLRVVEASEPAAIVFFPGWGEKKVFTRFLRPT